jgi:arginine exporter protein ArgO
MSETALPLVKTIIVIVIVAICSMLYITIGLATVDEVKSRTEIIYHDIRLIGILVLWPLFVPCALGYLWITGATRVISREWKNYQKNVS